jgi:hypothetical protein
MGLFLKIKNFFTGEEEPVTDFLVLTGELSAEVKVRELAFATAVSRIARSLSKCEIRTFEEGEEVKKDDYYRFNFEPNRNQNSSAWMQELIWRLYSKNEALVIEYDDQLLIAETFTTDVKAKVDWTFKGVVVNDFQFDHPFIVLNHHIALDNVVEIFRVRFVNRQRFVHCDIFLLQAVNQPQVQVVAFVLCVPVNCDLDQPILRQVVTHRRARMMRRPHRVVFA